MISADFCVHKLTKYIYAVYNNRVTYVNVKIDEIMNQEEISMILLNHITKKKE